ncbi:MAG TPA: SRPBCC domain-containing protein, partial [Streptomyces sp.]
MTDHSTTDDPTSGGTRIVGTLRALDGTRGAVRMEDVYATDADDLWSALTEPDRLKRWIGEVDGDLRPGGTFQARFTSTWEGPGRVDVCDAPHRLLLTMNPGQPDMTEIEALLTPDGDGTRLV